MCVTLKQQSVGLVHNIMCGACLCLVDAGGLGVF